jgi:rod shape-determining protein MreD
LRQAVVSCLALAAAFLLQTAVLPVFGVSSVCPDLILVVLIPAAMLWKPIPMAFMGAAVGLLSDILFGHGIGLYSIPYLLAPWLAGVYGSKFFRENAFVPAGLAGAAVALREILTVLMVYMARMPLGVTWAYASRVLASALLTAGLTVPYHLFFYSYMLKHERKRPGLIYFGR